jgi:hypothetical protein
MWKGIVTSIFRVVEEALFVTALRNDKLDAILGL